MHIAEKKKIVLLGMMTPIPVGGVVWQNIHYLIGLQRLGFDVYYVEQHSRSPSMFMETEQCDGTGRAVAFIAAVMNRFDLGDRWCYQALHDDGRFFGLSETKLRELFESAELIINLHGGTQPLPEHAATGRLIYVGTDPVALEIRLHNNVRSTIDFLAPHVAFFTFAENLGNADCRLPVSERFKFMPTRQPLVLDFWAESNSPGEHFTTVGNWHQNGRSVQFDGRTYTWSKDVEFGKFIDLPRRTSQTFELALSNCPAEAQQLLQQKGWRLRDAWEFSRDPEAYRSYIQNSRGEFTVAKEQNVELRSGWFSDRSATYLAAGRPVITQETGFSNILPTGEGLFGFTESGEILEAIAAINGDYEKHARAAREVARGYFSHELVLGRLLESVGSSARPAVASVRASDTQPTARL